MSNPEVLRFYDDIHSFTTNIVLKLKLPKIAAKQNAGGHMESQSCLSTAMVFFHKYFLFKKAFSHDYTKYLTCCTCVFLSLKVSNLIIPLEKLIDNFLFLYFRENYQKLNINEKLISDISNKIFQIEFEILNAIGFDLNVDLPYKYIYFMKPYFEESFNAQFYSKYILIVTSFINDSFKLPVCLFYEPVLIFLACVYLVEIYFKIQLKDKSGKKWFQLIDESVQFTQIEEISARIKMIYDYSNSNKTNYSSSGSLNLLGPKGDKGSSESKKFVIDFEPTTEMDNQEAYKASTQKNKVDKENEGNLTVCDNNFNVNICNEDKQIFGNGNKHVFICYENKINDKNNSDFNTKICVNQISCNYNNFDQFPHDTNQIKVSNNDEKSDYLSMDNEIMNEDYTNASNDAVDNLENQKKRFNLTNKTISFEQISHKNHPITNSNITNKSINVFDINNKNNKNNNNNNSFNDKLNNSAVAAKDILEKPFDSKPYNKENTSSICNNSNNNKNSNRIFTKNFEKEFLFKINTNYCSEYSRIKSDDHLKI